MKVQVNTWFARCHWIWYIRQQWNQSSFDWLNFWGCGQCRAPSFSSFPWKIWAISLSSWMGWKSHRCPWLLQSSKIREVWSSANVQSPSHRLELIWSRFWQRSLPFSVHLTLKMEFNNCDRIPLAGFGIQCRKSQFDLKLKYHTSWFKHCEGHAHCLKVWRFPRSRLQRDRALTSCQAFWGV